MGSARVGVNQSICNPHTAIAIRAFQHPTYPSPISGAGAVSRGTQAIREKGNTDPLRKRPTSSFRKQCIVPTAKDSIRVCCVLTTIGGRLHANSPAHIGGGDGSQPDTLPAQTHPPHPAQFAQTAMDAREDDRCPSDVDALAVHRVGNRPCDADRSVRLAGHAV